jgi:hypothetical protein
LVGAVNLHKLRVVDIHSEGVFDGFKVGSMSIGSKLDTIGKAGLNILHEFESVTGIARPH